MQPRAWRISPFLLALTVLASPAPAQRDGATTAPEGHVSRDADARFDDWQRAWKAYTDAALDARSTGRLRKGGELPEDVQAALDNADRQRGRYLEWLGSQESPPTRAWLHAAHMHERSRDYAAAVASYERAVGSAENPTDTAVLRDLCLAALNAKDPHVAAKWMRRMIDAERDVAPEHRRGEAVRLRYYPRVLIELGEFDALAELGESLMLEGSEDALAAGAQATFIAYLNLGQPERAESVLERIRAEPDRYPSLHGWAAKAKLAFDVHGRRFDAAKAGVDEYLASTADEDRHPQDAYARRHLEVVSRFLNRRAPEVVVDQWVGIEEPPEKPVLEAWSGHPILLDFWQPWCEPCRRAMPDIVELAERHDELRVIGLCKVEDYGYDVETKEAVRSIEPEQYVHHVEKFHQDMGLDYPLGIAREAVNNAAYVVPGIPTIVLIDRDGIVRYMSIGAGEQGLMELAVEGIVRR